MERTTIASLTIPSIIVLLFIAGCGLGGGANENQYYSGDRARYFQGVEGVEVRYDQFPPRLFYYGESPESSANDFPFSVEVQNKGASYSRGAVFISGYDPNLIEIDGFEITTGGRDACVLRLGDYSLNNFGMFMHCGDNFAWSGEEGNWLQSIKVRQLSWFGDSILSQIGVNYQHTDSGDRFDITLPNDWVVHAEQWEHGIRLIAILAGLNFQRFLGQEYLLAGDTYDFPGGEIDYLTYNAHIVNWPQGTDDIPQNFMLTNCYMYTTFAAPMVCIDPQPYNENRKVCRAGTATWKSSQGAPVAITSVTQENTPRNAIFTITVKNVGGGTVFDPGALEKCSPYYPGGARGSDQNVIWLGEVRIGNAMTSEHALLTCSPEHQLRLQNGQATFTCTYPIEYAELNSAYQTPLVIELWYGYSKVIPKTVTIKRVS